MCGRFTLDASRYDVADQFAVDETVVEEIPPRFNIAPTQQVLVVVESHDGSHRRLEAMRWGLVPGWAVDLSVGSRMINARAETVAVKPAFRAAFARRRCLIPASGYYEWQTPPARSDFRTPEKDGTSAQVGGEPDSSRRRRVGGGLRPHKVPHYFHRADGLLLGFGGLWESWHDPNDVMVHSCAIVTTKPNAEAAPVHDRMPLIVSPDAWDDWLAPCPLDPEEAERVLVPAPDGFLVADRVGEDVNNPRNDGRHLIEAEVG